MTPALRGGLLPRAYRVGAGITILLLTAALSGNPVLAQSGSPEILTTVPENPAFLFLGITPSKIVRPGGVRELGAAILSGIGEDGVVRQGVAIELAPWSLIPGLTISLPDYQKKGFKYVLANTQLSLGTVRAAGDTGSTDLAVAIRFTLYDGTDPMLDRTFTGSIGPALRPCTANPASTPDQIAECSDSTMARLYAERTERTWNHWALSFGAALGSRFQNSVLSSTRSRGGQVWVAGAAPIGSVGHLIVQGSWQHTPAGEDLDEEDLLSYGGRTVFGGPRFGLFGELIGESRSGTSQDDGVTWSLGAEFRVASNLWLATGMGKRFDRLLADDRTVVLANLRFGLADGSRLGSLR